MTDKTIWIINQHTATPKTTTGHFRHYYLAKEFKAKGYNVCLITGSFSHLSKRKEQPRKQFTFEDINGIQVCTVKVPKYKMGRSLGRMYNLVLFFLKLLFFPTRKFPRPDFILVSSMPLFPVLNGILFRKRFPGSKLIFEIRDIWPLTIVEIGGFSPNNIFVKILAAIEKTGYQKADYLTSVLPHANDHFEARIKRPVKFKHIPNGIDLASYENGQKLNRATLEQIPKDQFIVGYAGTLGQANSMETFIETAKLLREHKNISFIIVGEGYLKSQLQELAKGESNIKFLPAIPKQEVPALLQQFDICFLSWRPTSLYRFGVSANKIYDYMYAGKPIVMSGDIKSDEVNKADCGFVLAPEDTQAIANTILHLYTMPSEDRQKIGDKGKQFVLKNNTYSTLSIRYIDIFHDLSTGASQAHFIGAKKKSKLLSNE